MSLSAAQQASKIERAAKIERLVALGWRTADIVRELGVSKATVQRYAGELRRRVTFALPRPKRVDRTPAEIEQFIEDELASGRSARAVALELGLGVGRVQHIARQWRERTGQGGKYASRTNRNGPQGNTVLHPMAEALFEAGLMPVQVRERLGLSRSTVGRSRKRYVAAQDPGSLCECGRALGHHAGCTVSAGVMRPRIVTAKHGKPVRPIAIHQDPLYSQISAHISKSLDPVLRDDIIAEMYLAVTAGDLARENIKGSAKRYINAGFAAWADRYNGRSLDAPISADDSRSLVDLIEDTTTLADIDDMQFGSARDDLSETTDG